MYELTQNGNEVGEYKNHETAMNAMEHILNSLGEEYKPVANHTASNCDTGDEMHIFIYQTESEQHTFLIQKG